MFSWGMWRFPGIFQCNIFQPSIALGPALVFSGCRTPGPLLQLAVSVGSVETGAVAEAVDCLHETQTYSKTIQSRCLDFKNWLIQYQHVIKIRPT